MSSIFGRPRKKPGLDWDDQRAIRDELAKARELVPAAEQAVVEAQAALDALLQRRELVGIAVSQARADAWTSHGDELIVKDPSNPAVFLDLNADRHDETTATLRQREGLWTEVETEEGRLRVQVTQAGERRSYLRGQVRGLQDRLDQLAAGPAPRPDPNRLPAGGVAGLMAAGNERR